MDTLTKAAPSVVKDVTPNTVGTIAWAGVQGGEQIVVEFGLGSPGAEQWVPYTGQFTPHSSGFPIHFVSPKLRVRVINATDATAIDVLVTIPANS